jgi:hypothetical protein
MQDAGLDPPIDREECLVPTDSDTLTGLTPRAARNTPFTASGYRLTLRTDEKAALGDVLFRSRLMARRALTNRERAVRDGCDLQASGGGDGLGGTCPGSGGSAVLRGLECNTIVAIMSVGRDALCWPQKSGIAATATWPSVHCRSVGLRTSTPFFAVRRS